MRYVLFVLSIFVFGFTVNPYFAYAGNKAPAPQPYILPWQLRPAAPVSVVRIDSSLAMNKSSMTYAMFVLGSYKVWKNLSPFVRLGLVENISTKNGHDYAAITNPALGAAYTFFLPKHLRLTTALAFVIPVGMGGGDKRDNNIFNTIQSGNYARSAMDGAMYAVNDFTTMAGLDFAFVAHRWTVQLETSFLFLSRTRGAAVQKDTFKANMTSGLFVGYFIGSSFSLGAEIRYQRWLSTPVAVQADPLKRDTLSLALGFRFHFQIKDKVWIRPGFSYSRGLTGLMSTQNYDIMQFDLPIAF